MTRWLGALVLAACGSHAAGPGAPLVPPTCIRAEAADHTSGIQDFTFDADGGLTTQVEYDNTGKELARTTVTWSPDAITIARTGAFAFTQHGTLGPHGELVDLSGDGRHQQLHWDGTFAPAAAPRFAFETYYHASSAEPLLPLDTTWRGVWPRMRAFTFTGTVTLHDDARPDRDVRATYDHGHQLALTAGTHITKTTWRGDDPIEDTSDGDRRTFVWDHGHLAKLTGPDVTFSYDSSGNLTRVHGPVDVDISRCTSR